MHLISYLSLVYTLNIWMVCLNIILVLIYLFEEKVFSYMLLIELHLSSCS